MFSVNYTVTSFIIKGISDDPKLQLPIFLLVLLIYLITVGGNLTILLLVCLDGQLRTPMYFFLANLSILDMSCSTTTLHKIFEIFISENTSVSYISCLAQLYVFSSLTTAEFWILAAMSYDRYVAICRPLHYHMVMNHKCCALLAFTFWVLSFLEMTPHIFLLSHFTCFISNEIDHYFCDVLPIREITCSDTTSLDIIINVVGFSFLSFSFPLTFIPYVYIFSCILRINSNHGRIKAFYTCSSHITVVLMFYVTIFLQYMGSITMHSKGSNKLFSLLNTAVVPMLNPLIYSLKNKDVKSALGRMIKVNLKL